MTGDRLSLRRLAALCRKESFQIVRDPSSILIAFILPIGLLFIFGFGINLDATKIRLGVLAQDPGEAAQSFVATLAGSRYITLVPGDSRTELDRRLTTGDLRGMVVLASDFGRRLTQTGGQAPVQVITDGAEPNTANFVASYVQGVWAVWLEGRAADRGLPAPVTIDVIPRYWFNPAAISRNYLVPGSIAVIMTIIGALLTSLVVAREWERGTMEALLSTPVTRLELLLSKILPYYVLAIGAMVVCVAISVWILNVPFRGSLVVLMAYTTLFLGSALGLGLLLSTTTRNQFNAAQAALNAAFLPATMLSGFVFEIASMPTPVRLFSYLIPARYFVSSLQTLFQAGFVGSVLWRDALFLLLSAVFFLGLTARATRARLE